MARAETQKRWRESTTRRRLEAYIPAAAFERLEEIARRRGQRRPATLVDIIQAAEMPPEPAADPETPAVSVCPAEAAQAPETAAVPTYRLRKPATDAERRYAWIVATDNGPLCGIQKNPAYQAEKFGKKWRGEYLKRSLTGRWATAATREAVADKLLRLPEAYR